MSAEQSNLSNSHYGYDLVVATTQESINATMKEYLYFTTFPTVKMYWNENKEGNAVVVPYEELMEQTHHTDPLKVKSWNEGEPMTKDITNIYNSNFYFGLEASIGIPPDASPQDIPDIITLQETSQSVIFNLLSAKFTIALCKFGRRGFEGFLNVSQPSDSFWIFTTSVKLQNIIDNSSLPPAVQKQLDNLGPDAFSVQQLMFDLDDVKLESTPTISGVQQGTAAYKALPEVYKAYISTLKKEKAQPVLGYEIVKKVPAADSSTLYLTNLELEVSPYKDPDTKTDDDSGLNTLNYLCATNGKTLPPPVPFGWNWVDKSQESKYDGVISINRNTFVDYFKSQLTPLVTQNCFLAYAHVYLTGAFGAHIHYDHSLTPGQTPTISAPATGSKVLSYSHSSSAFDQAGLRGDMGRMRLSTTYNADVTFSSNLITITQTLSVTIYLRRYANSVTWNPVDKTYTDTYNLTVGPNGSLTANHKTKKTDNSEPTPKKGWFIELFTHLNDFTNDAAKWVKHFVATSYKDIPANVAQQFIFPGGKSFSFKDVSFSDNQDLVAHITYTQTKQNS